MMLFTLSVELHVHDLSHCRSDKETKTISITVVVISDLKCHFSLTIETFSRR